MSITFWPVIAQVVYTQGKEATITSPSAEEIISTLGRFGYDIEAYFTKSDPPACQGAIEKQENRNEQFKVFAVKLTLKKLNLKIYVTDSDANGFIDAIDLCQEFPDKKSIVIGQARKKDKSWQVEIEKVTYNQKHEVKTKESLPLAVAQRVMAKIFGTLAHEGYYRPGFDQ